ncbi:LEAF RUST 10 DISEASE-RESISTANCE LOCUS RECEPTOR-LIKE PROTEIN KINASE-like 2.2 [Corylus avellana]|uniref:LEAF RUST 10 DISEASE-RESISTANCE LOCUS RECEPTOR-LIKE PROTEIN KINASE-like 2.2 n=1 Tax=Corylus avellana TaxID=13451 RepID=UPI00286BF8EF|nr:LEAF RUST 10 DISEASE-RESISTANCE LOCUS RECEPTOR-LIKE PROTEIN KINASE-like 2.2 [Corylus avellana]
MGYSSTLLCLSTFIISLSLLALSSFTTADDAAVMSELLTAVSPTPSGWSASTSYCEWENVTCDGNSRVTIINLVSKNLSGILPSNLGSLTQLTSLSLQGNSFYGPLPSLANLSSLQQLYLDNNNFSSIPDGFFQGLTSLQTLILSQNSNLAPWTIPTELTQATSLATLYASNANVVGSLPDIFDSFLSLKDLQLSFNNFAGPLPKSFGGSGIQILWLDNQKNGLSGTIDVLSSMTQLKQVYLNDNNLTGSIPDSLATLPDLQLLDVSNNNLTGSIPKFTSTVTFNAAGNPLLGRTTPSSGNGGGTASGETSVSPGMIAAIVTLSAAIGVVIVVICCFRRKFLSNKIIFFWKKKSPTHQTVQTFLRNHRPLAFRRYSYSDIKKITNFFRDKLGEGGYGGVYKGKLQDGCLVAVKILKESRGTDGEEFINEVESISKTSHINIVSLMGFCFEGSKRALMYEFMPNGSLEKFIHKENPSMVDRGLEWMALYEIALGIARGLEYLHRGCNTRIVHFDIKPHNILLDENFCPKISDFGLAKICPREKSSISMSGTRGSAGYIAPEVYYKNFGGVSHKSDVYSYGMMVFEMVRGKRNTDIENTDCTSEIFFPHLIYKCLEQDEDLGLEGLINENDQECAKKMIIVSLWCIQTDPSSRPPISKVINMLEGSLESLQVPPKP